MFRTDIPTSPFVAGLLFAVLLSWMPVAQGQHDPDLPIRIEADRASLDDQRGVSIYRGNVTITQGDTVITGDEVTVHAPQRQLQRMVSEGRLATLTTRDESNREVRAEARRMEFFPDGPRVVLTGEARVWQGDDEFRGSSIVYNLEAATLEASTGDTGRVEAIFAPRDRDRSRPEGGDTP